MESSFPVDPPILLGDPFAMADPTKTRVVFSEGERNSILRLKEMADEAGHTFTNAAIIAQRAVKTRADAYANLLTATKAVEERVTEIARDNGVELKATDAGKWVFNFQAMELVRLDPPRNPEDP